MWVLPVIVYIALCAVGGKYFETAPPAGTQSTANKGGLALSYLSLQIGSGLGWAAVSADYVSHVLRSLSTDILINHAVRLFSRVHLQLDRVFHGVRWNPTGPCFWSDCWCWFWRCFVQHTRMDGRMGRH